MLTYSRILLSARLLIVHLLFTYFSNANASPFRKKTEEKKNREKEIGEILDQKQSDLEYIIRDRFTFRKGTKKELSKDPFLFVTKTDSLENDEVISFNDFVSEILNKKEAHIVFYIHGWGVSPEKAIGQAKSMQWIAESDYFSKDEGPRDILIIPIIWGTTVNPIWKIAPGYAKDTMNRAKESSAVIANLFNSFSDYQDAILSDSIVVKSNLLGGSSEIDEDMRVKANEELNSITELLEQKSDKKFHIIAHSMGNRTLKHTIRKMNEYRPGWGLFSSIHSVAADISLSKMNTIDGQLFKKSLKKSDENENKNIFVYYSIKDSALGHSSLVRIGGLPRLGSNGDKLNIQGIKVIDCTEISEIDDTDDDKKGNRHSYLVRKVSLAKEKEIEHRHTATLHAIFNNIRFKLIPPDEIKNFSAERFEEFLRGNREF